MIDKYDKLRKTDRNHLVHLYASEHPEASLRDIAEIFKITRQRVWQILKAKEKKEEAVTASG